MCTVSFLFLSSFSCLLFTSYCIVRKRSGIRSSRVRVVVLRILWVVCCTNWFNSRRYYDDNMGTGRYRKYSIRGIIWLVLFLLLGNFIFSHHDFVFVPFTFSSPYEPCLVIVVIIVVKSIIREEIGKRTVYFIIVVVVVSSSYLSRVWLFRTVSCTNRILFEVDCCHCRRPRRFDVVAVR